DQSSRTQRVIPPYRVEIDRVGGELEFRNNRRILVQEIVDAEEQLEAAPVFPIRAQFRRAEQVQIEAARHVVVGNAVLQGRRITGIARIDVLRIQHASIDVATLERRAEARVQ